MFQGQEGLMGSWAFFSVMIGVLTGSAISMMFNYILTDSQVSLMVLLQQVHVDHSLLALQPVKCYEVTLTTSLMKGFHQEFGASKEQFPLL
jgi:hypothetical protein